MGMTRRNASGYYEEETADSCLILNFRNSGLIEWTRNNALKPHSRWYFQILLKEGCENFLQSLSVAIITVVYVVFFVLRFGAALVCEFDNMIEFSISMRRTQSYL